MTAVSRSGPWQRRSERAGVLADRFPASAQILGFYRELASWQAEAAERIQSFGDLTRVAPSLIELAARTGPPVLARAASEIDFPVLETFLASFWDAPEVPTPAEFFARVLLEIYAGILPEGIDCPWCALAPQTGALRSQGDGLALDLVCALCFRHRAHPRGQCPLCEEAEESKLPSYSTSDIPHLRLAACEACMGYLIVVDLTEDPRAIPEVDELAALPLDVWAVEQGYRKLQPNIAGV